MPTASGWYAQGERGVRPGSGVLPSLVNPERVEGAAAPVLTARSARASMGQCSRGEDMRRALVERGEYVQGAR